MTDNHEHTEECTPDNCAISPEDYTRLQAAWKEVREMLGEEVPSRHPPQVGEPTFHIPTMKEKQPTGWSYDPATDSFRLEGTNTTVLRSDLVNHPNPSEVFLRAHLMALPD